MKPSSLDLQSNFHVQVGKEHHLVDMLTAFWPENMMLKAFTVGVVTYFDIELRNSEVDRQQLGEDACALSNEEASQPIIDWLKSFGMKDETAFSIISENKGMFTWVSDTEEEEDMINRLMDSPTVRTVCVHRSDATLDVRYVVGYLL